MPRPIVPGPCLFVLTALVSLPIGPRPAAGQVFVNFETPHVRPLEITPDRTRLLAVNTADNRLEVFTIGAEGTLTPTASIPVGLDPVSVRARNNTEAWVVNSISDSISIVDLTALNVRQTLKAGDEPADVVFAGSPQRAFVSVAQENAVLVFDPSNLGAVPVRLNIQGEEPRSLATDGVNVYAAVFESGNKTTILSQQTVSTSVNPYAGDPNPPPNAGAGFSPPIAPGLPPAPAVSLIVKKDSGGAWRDDNNGNWSAAVTWGLHDQDVAIINASTLGVSYAAGLMNLNMAICIGPLGRVMVVGTDATNQVRFEPNVKSTFVRVMMASFSPGSPGTAALTDLNPHLVPYTVRQVPQATRDLSIGDPRGVVFNAAGTRGYVSGMGSNNVLVTDGTGAPLARVEVGVGPTGVVLDETRSRLFVLNKFEGSVSVVDTAVNAEASRTAFYDPTPATIRDGRPFLYDTHATSGLGQASCGSCHVDARLDQLAWDLGDPSGAVKAFNQVCNFGIAGGCENWHPMKGPMTTQTLVGILETGPLHWRADRENFEAFNPTFVGLMGRPTVLTPAEMAKFKAFIGTIKNPPNPYRLINNGLPAGLFNGGNPINGSSLYNTAPIDGGAITCVQCHALPTGTNGQLTSAAALQETQSMKIPQLRNMYRKTGFSKTSSSNNRGFGFSHDGSVDTLFSFLQLPVFQFPSGATGTQQRLDIEAFLFCFSIDTHAAVGSQSTLVSLGGAVPSQVSLLDTFESLAASNAVGLVVKGSVGGLQRGYAYAGSGVFQTDRRNETVSSAALRALAAPGSELTYTIVPAGSQTRIGVDRDLDTFFDRDEVIAGSNPADPNSVPPPPCVGDINGDRIINTADLTILLANFGQAVPAGTLGDFDGNATVNTADLTTFLAAFGTACP